jgi:hypothetical protein
LSILIIINPYNYINSLHTYIHNPPRERQTLIRPPERRKRKDKTILHIHKMTYHVLIFMYRQPHLSPAEFKSYFETVHVKMVKELAGDLAPKKYIRRYVKRSDDSSDSGAYPAEILKGEQEDFQFDSCAELVYDDEAAFRACYDRLMTGENGKKIIDDENVFEIRSSAVVLDEVIEGWP